MEADKIEARRLAAAGLLDHFAASRRRDADDAHLLQLADERMRQCELALDHGMGRPGRRRLQPRDHFVASISRVSASGGTAGNGRSLISGASFKAACFCSPLQHALGWLLRLTSSGGEELC